MSADFVRQNRLVPLGWTVLRFTWAQVMRDPAYVANVIAQVLRAELAI
jgi:very-short-patch-repair endonuclease